MPANAIFPDVGRSPHLVREPCSIKSVSSRTAPTGTLGMPKMASWTNLFWRKRVGSSRFPPGSSSARCASHTDCVSMANEKK